MGTFNYQPAQQQQQPEATKSCTKIYRCRRPNQEVLANCKDLGHWNPPSPQATTTSSSSSSSSSSSLPTVAQNQKKRRLVMMDVDHPVMITETHHPHHNHLVRISCTKVGRRLLAEYATAATCYKTAVVEMNNDAVSMFRNGQYHDALILFQTALTSFLQRNSCPPNHTQETVSCEDVPTTATTPNSKRCCLEEGHHDTRGYQALSCGSGDVEFELPTDKNNRSEKSTSHLMKSDINTHEAVTTGSTTTTMVAGGDGAHHPTTRTLHAITTRPTATTTRAGNHFVMIEDPPKTSYMYQRMEFDEGMAMDLYPQTVPLQLEDPSRICDATLLFNVGQTYRKLDKLDHAIWYYERARNHLLSTLSAMSSLTTTTLGAITTTITKSSSISPTMTNKPSVTTATTKTTVIAAATTKILIPTLHNMGQLYYQMGNTEEALEAFSKMLKICRATLHHHPATVHGNLLYHHHEMPIACALNSLGVLYYHKSIDHSEKAIECLKDSLRMQIRWVADDDTAIATNATTNNTNGSNHHTEEDMIKMELDLMKTTPLLATTLNNLGRVHVQRDEFEEALVYYERALQIRQSCLGSSHIDYAATAFNAGQSLHQLKQLDRAMFLYHEFLRVATAKFGTTEHRDVAVVLSGIAQIHQERKEFSQAQRLYEESIRVGRAALGQHHSEIAMLLNRLGNFHFEQENLDDALHAYQQGLLIEKIVLDKTHPNIVVTLSNIGEVYRQKYDFDSAIRLYREVLRLQQLRFGFNSAEVGNTLSMTGLIYDQKGDWSTALKYLQRALILRRAVLGDDHLDVAANLTYLGTILYRKNMASTALNLLTESLRVRQTHLGREHRDVSFTMYNIGLCHHLQGNYEKAIECFCETLRVEKIVFGENHRDVSMTLFKLGETYKACDDLTQALQCFQDALRIDRQNPIGASEDQTAVARTLNEIGNLHMLRGEIVPMMESLSEATRIYRREGLSFSSLALSHQLYAFDISCPSSAPAA